MSSSPREVAVLDLVETIRVFADALNRGLSANTNRARLSVLGAVAERGPLRPREISQQLAMPAPSVTRHIQALQDAGHVTVAADPADQRTCLVSPTPQGRAELADVATVGAEVTGRVLADWRTAELRTLTQLLQRLTAAWAEHGEAARRPPPTRTPRWRREPQ